MAATVAALVLLAAAAPALGEATNPIQKVLEMLSDLQAKVIGEGKDSQKVYEEFSEWCEDSAKDLQFEIKTGKAQVAELTATINEETATIEALTTKIDELAASIATDNADLKAATEIRAKEAAEFSAEEKELVEVIDMLERAIAILEKEMSKSASMLQMKRANNVAQALSIMVDAAVFSAADASHLTSLLQSNQELADSEEDAALGAPAAAVYEGHSGGIIETMEGLLDKAKNKLDDARKTETTNLHNYELLKQSLEDEVKFASADMDKAKAGKSEAEEGKATAEGDLDVTSKDLAADVSSLADLHHECMTKAEEFEEETKSRGEELKALAEARRVIKEATGGATSQTYGLAQVSFVQLSSSTDLANFEAVRFVRDLAQKQNAPALAQLASRMSSAIKLCAQTGDDVFAKVKGLISEMIERLTAEGEADASHKAYCDKEFSETNAKKDDKEAEHEKLTTKINKAKAASAKLKEEVATLQKELADLAASQAEMDKLRAEEKAAYDANRPEMEKGVEGVKLALKILGEYYAAEGKAHAAAEGAGANIIGLLEVVESDFTKLLTEMIATEESAVAAYEKQTKENEVTKTTKEQDVKYKTKEAASLDKAVGELSADAEGVATELDALYEYLEKLHEMCDEKVEPYEERKARREAEIAGLKEALTILEGASLLQRSSSTRTLRGVRA